MTNRKRIVPALLTDKPEALEKMVRQCETFSDYIQVDIMDGKFVPSRSITAADLVQIKIKIGWEAHLMVLQPEQYFQDYMKAGAGKVIFHFEAVTDPLKTIESARRLGIPVGLAVNPETTLDQVKPYLKLVDSMLFMSVHPGYYGAKYLPEVVIKAAALRKISNMPIGMDGGIKADNALDIAQAGVDDICVGSAIFLQPDPKASYNSLVNLVRQVK